MINTTYKYLSQLSRSIEIWVRNLRQNSQLQKCMLWGILTVFQYHARVDRDIYRFSEARALGECNGQTVMINEQWMTKLHPWTHPHPFATRAACAWGRGAFMVASLSFLVRCSQLLDYYTWLVCGIHTTYRYPGQLFHSVEILSPKPRRHSQTPNYISTGRIIGSAGVPFPAVSQSVTCMRRLIARSMAIDREPLAGCA